MGTIISVLVLLIRNEPNLKDPGCLFGGKMFESIVDKASDIFDTLDPPEPSLINRTNYYGL